jgi:peptide/nickel transport system ATP-binding protein
MPVDTTPARGVDLTLENVTKSFGSRVRHQAVAPVSRSFDRSTRLGIVGESVSGKSTLARMLAGLETPSTGVVLFNGRDLREVLSSRTGRTEVRRSVQFIAQDTTSSFDPRRTLRWALTDPVERLLGLSGPAARERVDATLVQLGLRPDMADRNPGEVSGGQRQRFSIARALVVAPQLLICDEVVSALDVSVQGTVLNVLKKYCREQEAGLVFVSHGLPATAFVAARMMVMFRGEIVEEGPSLELLDAPSHEYTRSLVDAHRGPGDVLLAGPVVKEA